MVSPIDYTMNVLNPIEGYMQGLKFGEGLLTARQGRELAQNQEGRAQETFAMAKEDRARAIQQQQAKREQAARGQQALLEYLESLEAGTATGADLRRAMVENPLIAERFQNIASSRSQEQLANDERYFKQVAFSVGRNNIDVARNLIQERVDAAIASGDEAGAAAYKSHLMQLDNSPETLLGTVLSPLAATMKPDDFDKFHDSIFGDGEADGPLQVRSSQILDDGTVVTVTDAGPQVFGPDGERVTGQAAADAVRQAQEFGADVRRQREAGATEGRLTKQVELGAEVAGVTEAGKTAIQIGNKTFERIGPLRANIGRLDRAIELVKEEGANTGVIASRLPNWKASTVELNNLRSQLGLDVVGAVTFGALSKGELDLALTVALPTNLSEDKLVDWLERKRDAQDKLADYLTMQARFLTTSGRTLSQWIDFTESGEKDVRKWMRENPVGRRTERVPSDAPTATPETASDNAQFVKDMQAKANRGEPFTRAEINRLNAISQGDQ